MQYYYPPRPSGLDRFAPRVTRILIFLNIVLWVCQRILPARGIDITDCLGLHYFEGSAFSPIQLVTYMFLHSTESIWHLLNNMFMLWMFGSVLERYWGERRYLCYYIVTGVTAALVQEVVWYFDFHELTAYLDQFVDMGGGFVHYGRDILNMPLTVGASGAVFGLLLAYGVSFPNAEMFLFFLPIPIKAKYMVLLFGLYELFQGVHATGSSIAHFAHLGGMLGGIILLWLWRPKRPFIS